MIGFIRPENKIPKIESASNADLNVAAEKLAEKTGEIISEASNVLPSVDPLLSAQQIVQQNQAPDNQLVLEKVEKILAQDMDSIFLSLDAQAQAEFKRRGEETSRKIVKLLGRATVPIKKIVNLIIAWLRVIPHVNRFYLEQEAKIKTDKIMRLTIKK